MTKENILVTGADGNIGTTSLLVYAVVFTCIALGNYNSAASKIVQTIFIY